MSLLWPERFYAGLFPGSCWLQSGREPAAHSMDTARTMDHAVLLENLDALLAARVGAGKRKSRLSLTVTDQLCAFVTLPWQDALQRPAELANYAKIQFETHGIDVNDSWVMHTEFRQYRATGIAYAFRKDWLAQLLQILAARKIRLMQVLPVSAAAYAVQRLPRNTGQTLLLLREPYRLTAQVYGRTGLLAHDVEPVTAGTHGAGLRLQRRTEAAFTAIGALEYWSSAGSEETQQPSSFTLSGVEACALPRGRWME